MRPFAILLLTASLLHAEWRNLWPDEAPGAPRPPAGTESTYEGGRMKMIEVPQYWLHLPERSKSTGAAAVIFPGGGYGILAMEHEGHAYAKWLNERGIAGIVVKYRVGPGLGYGYPVPFLDARRAIRTVRANAAEWGIRTDRIGVMGSSAGGHLASLCATRFGEKVEGETDDTTDRLSARPDFAVLCYPVITMEEGLGHPGSRQNLTGKGAQEGILGFLSTEQAVSPQTPPVFLLTTFDDGVDCRNSLLFATACKANKVPVALHLFEKGGHGYGLNGKEPVAAWPELLEAWLDGRWK